MYQYFVISVQKIKCKGGLGPTNQCQEPSNPQQLVIRFKERAVRTHAEPNTDKMVAREVKDDNSLGLSANRAYVSNMNEVDDESEAFKGCVLKETTIP